MKKLAILGASGHGKVLADIALLQGWDEVVFFDDAWPEKQAVSRWPIAGDGAALLQLLQQAGNFDGAAIGIGHCATRLEKYRVLAEAGVVLPVLQHPRAVISTYAQVGAGSVFMASSVVNVDAQIGAACIINTGATVDHDCVLGEGVHIAPGAHVSGGVTIDEGTWVGVGACVRQGLYIGAGAMVGAGAVVLRDVPAGATVVGNPARPLI